MTEQLALTGSPVEILADGRTLTDRQKLVYDWVREVQGGMTADEVGALLHHRKGKHGPDGRCQWCTAEGESALRTQALASLLIRRRPSGKWEPRNPADRARAESGQTGEIPF